jgi:D-psicose/D-tagatose/L-ribulose 3-epimerase
LSAPSEELRAAVERRIACVTYGYRHLSLEGALRRIAANGFHAVEVVGTRPHLLPEDFPGDELEGLRSLLVELQLRVCAVACFSAGSHWHFTAPNRHIRGATVDHVKRCIDVAAALGAPVVQSITGAPVIQDVPLRDAWRYARDGLRECAEHAEARGVRIGLEAEENTIVRTSADTLELIAEVGHPSLAALLDIGHANMVPADDPVRAAEVLLPHLVHCHAHDNAGVFDEHGPLGGGTVDWPQVARALRGYEGAITIEVGSPNPDGVAARGRDFLVEQLLGA